MALDPKPLVSAADVKRREDTNIGPSGLKVERMFTKDNSDPYADVKFEKRTSKIVNPDGSTVFEMKNVEVPDFYSQVATDILAQKYFRRQGVPQVDADGEPITDEKGEQVLGSETSVKQVIHRLANTWRWWGESYGYFNRKVDAQIFEDEVKYMLMHQMVAPNSPQWFNTGLRQAYGIKGVAQGHWYVDPETGKAELSPDAYTHMQVHACFIQGLRDDLVNQGGIMDLVTREARAFKYGSGTGSNFSTLRGANEKLSGGGSSSGMMSFLNVFDAAAGAIKSGGTTRRAAKMVCVDIDHPEVEQFIEWKAIEEQKVADIVVGSYQNYRHLKRIMESAETGGYEPEKNPELKKLIKDAADNFIPLNYVKRTLLLSKNGVKAADFDFRRYDTDFRSDAYATVGGQNANNSVRVTNEFLKAVQDDGEWDLINRTNGKVHKTVKAKALWDLIVEAAWMSADPGLQYDTTINEWHTCPVDGRINASNPCSEYMFLDDTACNLASFNLVKFLDEQTGEFDTEKFIHATRLMTMVLEISVLMSHLLDKEMAERTYNYRTLGLGYANIGGLLMYLGIPYDSEEAFAITGAITALMTGEAYATSAEMAKVVGAFARYEANKNDMLRVMRNHRRAAYNAAASTYEGLTVTPMGINPDYAPKQLLKSAKEAWDYALQLGDLYGYRNAQTTCIAPTGTIALVMDCDATGIEPNFALVKFKKLVGGGYFKLVDESIEPALRKLGYTADQILDIKRYAIGSQSLLSSPHINRESLTARGFTDKEFAAIEATLPSVFELKYAFSKWTIGEDFCKQVLGLTEEQLNDPSFNLLKILGFTDAQIQEAENHICGMMTTEGAPHLKEEHYAVFDCANKCGKFGKRFISYKGHLKQMAAAQPFISGAISKTINLPEDATLADVHNAYHESWELMLKATALYRDGSKLSQPLNTSSADDTFASLFMFESAEMVDETVSPAVLQTQIIQHGGAQPVRRRLPDERHSITHKFSIGGHKGFITVGLYEDGTPGEIFITMNKEGTTLSGIMDAWAVSLSWNLQYGVPLEELIRKYVHVRFEPSGMTINREIPMAKSIVDYVARWLALRFLEPERAKLYHNTDLVEMSYQAGTNSRVLIPYINGQGHTEFKGPGEEMVMQVPTTTHTTLVENLDTAAATVVAAEPVVKTVPLAMASVQTQTKMDLGEQSDGLERMVAMQREQAMKQVDADADICSNCGSIMIRNGSCYVCPACGETSGCS